MTEQNSKINLVKPFCILSGNFNSLSLIFDIYLEFRDYNLESSYWGAN
jgi:hypothetical protein